MGPVLCASSATCMHAIRDVRHLLVDALPCSLCGIVPALFSPAKNTLPLFMWQHDTGWWAHSIMDCIIALSDAPDDASISALAPGGCILVAHT